MNYYSEEQVKRLLAEQRHICQIERDKRSYHDERGWFVHCEDVMNAEEPKLPQSGVSGCCAFCLKPDYCKENGCQKTKYSDSGYQ